MEPLDVSDLVTSVPRLCITPNHTFAYRNGVAESVENMKLILFTVQKIHV